jgi:histone demethylase JARID1
VAREYAANPWNLNNLPQAGGAYPSMLRFLEEPITGVSQPWLYVGMQFSSSCWRVEDHLLYCINYHHVGEPQRWYSVPNSFRDAFEVRRGCEWV